jgi:hypothetical protein
VLWGLAHACSPNQDWRKLTTVYTLYLAHGLLVSASVESRMQKPTCRMKAESE